MIRRAPFTTPMRALRRYAWTCARDGALIHWDDPMPARGEIPAARISDSRGGRPC